MRPRRRGAAPRPSRPRSRSSRPTRARGGRGFGRCSASAPSRSPSGRTGAGRRRASPTAPTIRSASPPLRCWRWRSPGWRRLRAEPAPVWLALAVLLTSLATVLGLLAPPLLAALLAALAFATALAAFAPAGTPVLPLAGLAILALPVVSSLQFYAGYPLRVVTAEASRWLLGAAGFDATREGSAMLVDGRLVIVDAPCSGVQMVWMAWFCASAVACWRELPDRIFARRLAFVGAIVLAGNIVRNALLVGLEARDSAASPWQHEAIGMVVLGLVCAAVA